MNVRVQLLAPAVPGLLGLSLLVAACGASSTTSAETTTTPQSRQDAALAFSRCMRSHGVASFPDPDPQGSFPSFAAGVPKQASAAANDACKHLLPNGGTGTPQQRQLKLAFAVKVAECLRTHGYPSFPDPTASGQRIPPGLDTRSSRFQAVETSCEHVAGKALGLP